MDRFGEIVEGRIEIADDRVERAAADKGHGVAGIQVDDAPQVLDRLLIRLAMLVRGAR